jgi:replicative DNA helicase
VNPAQEESTDGAAPPHVWLSSEEVSAGPPLPQNLDAEKFTLGAILCDPDAFLQAAGILTADDFGIEKHKRIFLRMLDLHTKGERIDRVTLANELIRHRQLESVDGLTYITSLDEGLPHIYDLASYIQIVKEKSRLRRIITLTTDIQNRARSDQEPANAILASAEDSFLRLSDFQPHRSLYTPTRIVQEYPGGVNAFLDPSKRVQGVPTGFSKFDEMTGGFHEGELIILAARPAVGKSSLAACLAENISCHRYRDKRRGVALFSLEMSKESILTRMVCSRASVDQRRFRAGYLNHDERDKLQTSLSELSEARLYIDDSSAVTTYDLHSKVRRLQNEDGDIGLVIVDYLQLMQGSGKFESAVQEISLITRGLKLMAKDLKVPFLVLSQLSRAPETRAGDHRPQLSDLRQSGSIEQDADLVAFVFRESIYKPDKEHLKGIAELILAKQREGPTGIIKLVFLDRLTRFENLAQEGGEQEGPFE